MGGAIGAGQPVAIPQTAAQAAIALRQLSADYFAAGTNTAAQAAAHAEAVAIRARFSGAGPTGGYTQQQLQTTGPQSWQTAQTAAAVARANATVPAAQRNVAVSAALPVSMPATAGAAGGALRQLSSDYFAAGTNTAAQAAAHAEATQIRSLFPGAGPIGGYTQQQLAPKPAAPKGLLGSIGAHASALVGSVFSPTAGAEGAAGLPTLEDLGALGLAGIGAAPAVLAGAGAVATTAAGMAVMGKAQTFAGNHPVTSVHLLPTWLGGGGAAHPAAPAAPAIASPANVATHNAIAAWIAATQPTAPAMYAGGVSATERRTSGNVFAVPGNPTVPTTAAATMDGGAGPAAATLAGGAGPAAVTVAQVRSSSPTTSTAAPPAQQKKAPSVAPGGGSFLSGAGQALGKVVGTGAAIGGGAAILGGTPQGRSVLSSVGKDVAGGVGAAAQGVAAGTKGWPSWLWLLLLAAGAVAAHEGGLF